MRDIAIVTGGSSGLGLEISRELLRRKINVCIVGRNEEKLDLARKTLLSKALDAECIAICGDISYEQFVSNLYSKIKELGFSVRYLFNNAGEGRYGSVEQITREMIDTVLSGLLIGLMLMSSRAVVEMAGAEGYIVNILSTAALRVHKHQAVYNAAKWGARGFAESLREAVKGTGVRIISVFPGGLDTEWWKPDIGWIPKEKDRFMKPEKVAEMIVGSVMQCDTNTYVKEIVIDRSV